MRAPPGRPVSPPLGTALGHEPRREASVTEAGARVFALAEAAGVFFSHFEYAVPAPGPASWAPTGRPDLGEILTWRGGVLPETKFRHFRLDRPVASYHPGQRSKWTTHELCHQLVGFAWWPGMSRLEIACMARVAEALPVALWYFFDESARPRCPAHVAHDAFSAGYCRRCEAVEAPAGPADERLVSAGMAFLGREIDSATASLRDGTVYASPHASVDLASDGLAWASAHAERLRSPEFASWMARFRSWGDGWRASMDELVATVEALGAHLAHGGPPVLPFSPPALRVKADLGWRLISLAASLPTRGRRAGVRVAVLRLVDDLERGLAFGELVDAYRDLGVRDLPSHDEIFGVGYRVSASRGDDGLAVAQVARGVESALPLTASRLDDLPLAVRRFVAGDRLERRPLARRFAASLLAGSPEADLARLEAALADPGPAPLGALALAPDVRDDAPLVLAPEAELVSTDWEVLPVLEGEPPYAGPSACLVVRGADGDPRVYPLSPWARGVVTEMAGGARVVPPDEHGERARLVEAGAWVAAPAGGGS